MDNTVLKQEIQRLASEVGIDKIGFTNADPFDELASSLREQKAMGHTTGFEHQVLEERLYPDLIFDQPKSIISIALAYPSRIKEPLENTKEVKRGQFARASWGIDYHTILREKMECLIEEIKVLAPHAHFKAMVDTGELMDVAVAQRAGIGFIGRNGLLITEEFGSWIYLGEIVTDLEIAPDEPVPFGCGDCYRCVNACPTGALLGDGRMNGQRCLSYQTQTKGYMPEEFRKKISNVIYGCDICQHVCPYNQGIDFHRHPEMEPDSEVVQPALKPLLTISNRAFRETYGHLAGSWRGKKPLQRNAIIALVNSRDRTALPQLIQVMEEDPRPMMRGTAAWAISKLQRDYNAQLLACVKAQYVKETDKETIDEMRQAIHTLERKRPAKKPRR
ncbi:tRNA epoxyqueuosine(34) reductase QueG [Suicoccus acidiformans]|uniref:tRNA epoxyqueuosine(34) reductase QueG n=1 Tax=Suicoccus acidiformans TaxID=2036206 RepID=A0A347WLP2_9LACT|nr:tRNA epoxyqueuosine(34) reductase QueG [Suicoccus acidiformans]AXY25999.1 tRNA epoxyqueuosine(34) reductase QueG [Suicoccus acidiformans]